MHYRKGKNICHNYSRGIIILLILKITFSSRKQWLVTIDNLTKLRLDCTRKMSYGME